jgi:TrpR family trp operon transcriptional repressor
MTKFLGEIFTSHELRDLALRWQLMTMLHQGMAQRRIAAELGISLCKITRGARVMKNSRSMTRRLMGMKKRRWFP